jgi:hypothetical protein
MASVTTTKEKVMAARTERSCGHAPAHRAILAVCLDGSESGLTAVAVARAITGNDNNIDRADTDVLSYGCYGSNFADTRPV